MTRFAFGKNWSSFSRTALDSTKIDRARKDFRRLLGDLELAGRSFLDIGFGQGLSLFLASEAGAKARGVDIDSDNLTAFEETSRYFPGIARPATEVHSILDDDWVSRAEPYDIVHSWGVLHHTGAMHHAIGNAARLVRPRGYFIMAIYNTHWSSGPWWLIKWFYNRVPAIVQRLLIAVLYPVIYVAKWLVTRKSPTDKERGMDFLHDVVDWVGGYPYEHANIEAIKKVLAEKGFDCLKAVPAGVPTGCNEFVFRRRD